jgi:hypothetical protein
MARALPHTVLTVCALVLALPACDKRKADTAKPPGTTCEETRDECLVTCEEDCEDRTYCEQGDSPEYDACVATCEETYTACIL